MSGISTGTTSAIAGVIGLTSAFDVLSRSIQLAADQEAMSTTMRVLIGDAKLAEKTLSDLQTFALKTPFEMPELMESAKQMIAFGEEADKIVGTMNVLGDVSSGLEIPLKDLTYLYGTLKSQGRAFTVDIRQFAQRGIPIYVELAKVLGLVGMDAKKVTPDIRRMMDAMIESGQVGFDQVEAAFKNMTGVGGAFFNMMEERSQTLKGVWNEMKETIAISLRTLGENLIKGLDLNLLIRQISQLSNRFNDFIKGLSSETKKAIMIVTALVATFVALSVAIVLVTKLVALATGGLSLIAGAITIAIAGTAAWVYQMGGLKTAWKSVKRAASDFWDFVKPMLPAIVAGMLLLGGPITVLVAGIGLMIYYWKDVKQAVIAFYEYVKPTLQALWSLTKTVAFALRDNLISAFDEVSDWFKVGFKALGKLISSVLGEGFNIMEWKEDFQGLVMLGEWAFKTINAAAVLLFVEMQLSLNEWKADFKYFFVKVLPSLFGYVGDHWRELIIAMIRIGKVMVTGLVDLVVNGIASIPDILKGNIKLEDVLSTQIGIFRDKLKTELASIQKSLPALKLPPPDPPTREEVQKHLSLLGKQLGYQDKLNDIGGFAKFREKKLLEFKVENAMDLYKELWEEIIYPAFFKINQKSGEEGEKAGVAFAGSFAKEAKRIEAVIIDSAEARTRMQEYRDSRPDLKRPLHPFPPKPVIPPIPDIPKHLAKVEYELAPMPHFPRIQPRVVEGEEPPAMDPDKMGIPPINILPNAGEVMRMVEEITRVVKAKELTLEFTKIEIPDVKIPKVEIPEAVILKVTLPKIEIPNIALINQLQVPQSIKVSKLDIPRMELPSVLPNIDQFKATLDNIVRTAKTKELSVGFWSEAAQKITVEHLLPEGSKDDERQTNVWLERIWSQLIIANSKPQINVVAGEVP